MMYCATPGDAYCLEFGGRPGAATVGAMGGQAEGDGYGDGGGFNCCGGGGACGYEHCPALGEGQDGCVQPWAMPNGMDFDTDCALPGAVDASMLGCASVLGEAWRGVSLRHEARSRGRRGIVRHVWLRRQASRRVDVPGFLLEVAEVVDVDPRAQGAARGQEVERASAPSYRRPSSSPAVDTMNRLRASEPESLESWTAARRG